MIKSAVGSSPSEQDKQAQEQDLIERAGHLARLARIRQIDEMTKKTTISSNVVWSVDASYMAVRRQANQRIDTHSAVQGLVTYSFTRLP